MNASEEIKKFIGKGEGFREEAYQPLPQDKWTIGYGFTMLDGASVKPGDTIDESRANLELDRLVQTCALTLSKKPIPKNVTQHQFDAVVSLAYNVGCTKFMRSNTGRMFYAGENISHKFIEWSFFQGKSIKGLLLRRQREQAIYDFGHYGV